MPERVILLSTTVPTPPAVVLDFLLDLDRHHGPHPFLVRSVPG